MNRISPSRHSSIHVLSKFGLLDGEAAARVEFDWMVLGLKLTLLNRITPRVLRRKYVKALLPNNLNILLRNATADISILYEIYLKKIYEKHCHLKPGDVVFDVGSHIGVFALKASRLVGSSGVVYSFEPEPENFMLLKRNVASNNALNVKIFDRAVSSQSAMLHLHVHPTNTGMSSVQYATGRTAQISVSSITLDQVIKKYGIQHVDLLKLDVEGHELEVLRGANRFLSMCKHIVMETHEKEGGPPNAQIIETLKKYNFKIELVYSELNDILYGWK